MLTIEFTVLQFRILVDMRNFAFWQQVTSGGGTSYNFSDYSHPSNFSTCKTTVRNLITAQSLSNIGADTKIVLQFVVNRLTTVTNVTNTNSWAPYGTTTINYNLTYPTKDPDPVVPTGNNVVTFEVRKNSDSSLVANGTLTFLSNDGASESYIEIDFIISQVI
jgi:hypothetical protein